jgi:hypothetical protein
MHRWKSIDLKSKQHHLINTYISSKIHSSITSDKIILKKKSKFYKFKHFSIFASQGFLVLSVPNKWSRKDQKLLVGKGGTLADVFYMYVSSSTFRYL